MSVGTEKQVRPLDAIADALDDLADAVDKLTSEERTLAEMWGNQFPVLNKDELRLLAEDLAQNLRDKGPDSIDRPKQVWVPDTLARIAFLKGTVVPSIYAGNPGPGTSYVATLTSLNQLLTHHFMQWDSEGNLSRLPAKLVRRISAASTRVEQVERDAGMLDGKVATIVAAHDAADQLEVDMESLRKAAETVTRLEEASIKASQRVDTMESGMHIANERIAKRVEEADSLIAKCEVAYRITTTQGLASAFDQRAEKLRRSTNWWAAWLAVALIGGTCLGLLRISALSAVLTNEHPNWGVISLHMVLSVVSVGAPLWFAWMATKQIQQRFKLAEDYAFKASVAKAYEGYRKEAVEIDQEFVSRLFASALTRLEEAPLRMLDGEKNHGGPWHELVQSEGFRQALEKSELLARHAMDTASTALKNAISKTKSASNDAKAAESTGGTGTSS